MRIRKKLISIRILEKNDS